MHMGLSAVWQSSEAPRPHGTPFQLSFLLFFPIVIRPRLRAVSIAPALSFSYSFTCRADLFGELNLFFLSRSVKQLLLMVKRDEMSKIPLFPFFSPFISFYLFFLSLLISTLSAIHAHPHTDIGLA